MGSLCSSLFGSSASTSYQPPAAVTSAVTDILNRAATQSNQPYPQYTPDVAAQYQNYNAGLLAPFSPNQTAAGQTISGLQGYTQPNFQAATGLAAAAANPLQMQQFSPNAVNQYMNPYLNDVVGSAVANINQTNAQQQQQVLGSTIGQGAYGGDRAGIAQAELARQQNLANNATIANLLGQGYSQAQQEFNQQQGVDLATQLQNSQLMSNAALNLANLGTQGQQAQLQQAQAQYGYGTAEQQQQQAGLSTAYQQYLNEQAFPYQQLSYYAGLASGAAPALGGTTTGYSPTVSNAGGVLGSVGILGALSNPGAVSSSNPLSAVSAGFGTLGNVLPAIFNEGGRVERASGGRAHYADAGAVQISPVTQAYNDYLNAITAHAPRQVLEQLYQKYQQSLQGATPPWKGTATTTTPTTTTPTTPTTTSTSSMTPTRTGGGSDTSSNLIGGIGGPGDQGGPVDAYGVNPRAGDTAGFGTGGDGTIGGGGGYGQTGTAHLGVLGSVADALEKLFGVQTPAAALAQQQQGQTTNQTDLTALPSSGQQYDFSPTTNQMYSMQEAGSDTQARKGTLIQPDQGIDLPASRSAVTMTSGLVDPNTAGLMNAIQSVESGGISNPHTAVGDGGAALGAFQMHNPAAQQAASELGLNYTPSMRSDPVIGPQLAQQYMSDMFNFTGSVPGAIAAYNMGPGAYANAVAAGFDPTQNDYTQKVLGTGLVNTNAGIMPPGAAPLPPENPATAIPGILSTPSGLPDQGPGAMDPASRAMAAADQQTSNTPSETGPENAGSEGGGGGGDKRGGRIGPHHNHYAAGGFTPITMQYGMPTQEDLGIIAQDLAGTGVGSLPYSAQATAAKGVLPSAKGGRIHARYGQGITGSDDDGPIAGDTSFYNWDDDDTDTSYLPIEKAAPEEPWYKKGFAVPQIVPSGLPASYEERTKNAKVPGIDVSAPGYGKDYPATTKTTDVVEPQPLSENDKEYLTRSNAKDLVNSIASIGPQNEYDPILKAERLRREEARPSRVSDFVGASDIGTTPSAPTNQPDGTYDARPSRVADYPTAAKTQPVVPKLDTDDLRSDAQTVSTDQQPVQKNVQVAQDMTRTQSDAPQPGFGYIAPPPIDMRQMAAFNFGANLLAGGDFGTNLARAGHDYANTMLAQQDQQRATMLSQAQAAQAYGSAQSSQATAGKTRAEEELMRIKPNVFGGNAWYYGGTPENPEIKTIPMGTAGQSQMPSPATGLGDPIDSVLDQYGSNFRRTNEQRFMQRPEVATQYQSDFLREQQEAAKVAAAANSGLGDLKTMAQALTAAEGSKIGMGVGSTTANAARRYVYGIARGLGYNGDSPESDDPVVAQQELNKIRQFLANAQVGSITHNGAARLVEATANAQPNVELEPEAGNKLFTSLARQNVMGRDYQKIVNAYGGRTGGMGIDVQQAYQDAMSPERYNREQDVLQTLMDPKNSWKDSNGRTHNLVTDLLDGTRDRKAFDAKVSQYFPEVKNLSRWLVN